MKLTEKLLNEIYIKIISSKNGPFNEEKIKGILKTEIDKNQLTSNTIEGLFGLIMEKLKIELEKPINNALEKDINLSKENLKVIIKEEAIKKNIIIKEDFLNELINKFK